MFNELKVLELASVLAGPAVGQFFAELGATVIKVENIKTKGDVTRSWKTSEEDTDDRSAYFCSVNWGKKSISVDLESKEGRSVVHSLATQCDLVIASYKPGDASRLAVDYKSLRKLNPKLIYGQITGYGSHDPRVGYDAVMQAEAGFMSMNGEPGRPSLKMPVAMIDILAAHQLKEGILLAMLRQTRSGAGAFVEVSLLQSAISSLVNQGTNWLIGKKIPSKLGSAHPNIAPYGDVFLTGDDHEVLLAIGTDAQFRQLCESLSISAIAGDSRFTTNSGRVINRATLHVILQQAIKIYSGEVLMDHLKTARIPAGLIKNLQEVFELSEAKEILLTFEGLTGIRSYIGTPLPDMPSHFLPPPHEGEHTFEILSEMLKIDGESVRRLISGNVVR